MSELARVSSERTALQVQVDKQAKAAREEALLGARSPLRLSVLYRFGFLLFLSTGAARCALASLLLPCVVSVALVGPLGIFVGFVLPYIRQTFAYPSDTHPVVRFCRQANRRCHGARTAPRSPATARRQSATRSRDGRWSRPTAG